MLDLFSVEGKVALVTGAGRGIGAATAQMLSQAGASVIVNDFGRQEACQQVIDRIKSDGGNAVAVDADVGDSQAVANLMSTAVDRFGEIDILVNNAAILSYSSLVDLSEADWDAVLRVNLTGQFLCSKLVLPGMIERREGRIINVASEQALVGKENLAHYCASKGGVISMSKALAREVSPYHITVNVVAPGPIRTPIWDAHPDSAEYRKRAESAIPLGHLGAPEDIASTILFLASPAAGFYTGWVFSPNGGTVM